MSNMHCVSSSSSDVWVHVPYRATDLVPTCVRLWKMLMIPMYFVAIVAKVRFLHVVEISMMLFGSDSADVIIVTSRLGLSMIP